MYHPRSGENRTNSDGCYAGLKNWTYWYAYGKLCIRYKNSTEAQKEQKGSRGSYPGLKGYVRTKSDKGYKP